jgi:hypothetical protein
MEKKTVKQLRVEAKQSGLSNYSKLRKAPLKRKLMKHKKKHKK